MRFFIADEHIDHEKVITHMGRPFSCLEEMEQIFVDKHNAVVRTRDEVYHLGDVAFKYESHARYIRRLNGNHFLIKGNHERSRDVKRLLRDGKPYGWIKDVYMIKKPQLIWLSHYAHLSWPQAHYGCIHLHGHSHGNLRTTFGKMIDVGIDTNDFYPYPEDIIIEMARQLDFEPIDHDRRRNE